MQFLVFAADSGPSGTRQTLAEYLLPLDTPEAEAVPDTIQGFRRPSIWWIFFIWMVFLNFSLLFFLTRVFFSSHLIRILRLCLVFYRCEKKTRTPDCSWLLKN